MVLFESKQQFYGLGAWSKADRCCVPTPSATAPLPLCKTVVVHRRTTGPLKRAVRVVRRAVRPRHPHAEVGG